MISFRSVTPTDQELELKFLRHLAYRAYHEGGKYLSVLDKQALERLSEAHAQDTATTSVADLAVIEFYTLNPQKKGKVQ